MKPRHSQPTRATGSTSSEPDDGVRGQVSVVVSLLTRPDGTVRVVFDDARSAGDGRWAATGFFTSRDYPAVPFMDMDLQSSEFESAGLSVLSRLLVMANRQKP